MRVSVLMTLFLIGCDTRAVSTGPEDAALLAAEGSPDRGIGVQSRDSSVQADVATARDAGRADAGDPLSPCLVGGNVFHATGDAGDWVSQGKTWHDTGSWTASLSSGSGVPRSYLYIRNYSPHYAGWFLNFILTTRGLGHEIKVGSYFDAMNVGKPGHPGLDVGIDGRGCNESRGSFRIHRFRRSGDVVEEVAVTFQHRCGVAPAGLRGCLYYHR